MGGEEGNPLHKKTPVDLSFDPKEREGDEKTEPLLGLSKVFFSSDFLITYQVNCCCIYSLIVGVLMHDHFAHK